VVGEVEKQRHNYSSSLKKIAFIINLLVPYQIVLKLVLSANEIFFPFFNLLILRDVFCPKEDIQEEGIIS
jgi:hypothetical protein